MPQFAYAEVDVFAGGDDPAAPLAFSGNPLAVVHDADALSDAQMQAFARWTNLSETTFLLRPTAPGADYRVRIFTPGGELPFAGHPTLGSAHAWLEAGGAPAVASRVVQQCDGGLVRVRRAVTDEGEDEDEDEGVAFEAPPLRIEPVDAPLLDAVLRALGVSRAQVLDARWLDNGPRWLGLLLDGAARVLAIDPDHAALRPLAMVGVIGAYAPGGPSGAAQFEVRAFAPAIGVPEDPVTGSLNAGFAQWLIPAGRAPARYTVAQGARVHRDGRVRVERDAAGATWVGGRTVTRVRGTLTL